MTSNLIKITLYFLSTNYHTLPIFILYIMNNFFYYYPNNCCFYYFFQLFFFFLLINSKINTIRETWWYNKFNHSQLHSKVKILLVQYNSNADHWMLLKVSMMNNAQCEQGHRCISKATETVVTGVDTATVMWSVHLRREHRIKQCKISDFSFSPKHRLQQKKKGEKRKKYFFS